MRQENHEVDFCIVGGGMAGLTAALTAARNGLSVILMHDRPVLGGNASSECRVHIGGADVHSGRHLRETGILEELRLENCRRNANMNFSIWDLILYEKAKSEENLTLIMNCSCLDMVTENNRIVSIKGWQLTTETYHIVKAKLFADCSGDGILAPLSGAEFRIGREGRDEYGESIAPEVADDKTMGMTCYFKAREYDTPQPYEPPAWIEKIESDELLPQKPHSKQFGFWWIELGGEDDTIHDTESIRDRLLPITLGVWNYMKNHSDMEMKNWALDWIQFLPAKRESRRYIGDHVLTQNDIESEGKFDDLVAYGGWSMDDHFPAGFRCRLHGAAPTIFHHAPSPYGIPYRSMYSKNIENLFCGGRCISATHSAMSSTRVIGTCMSMAQAMGIAAVIAVENATTPRGVNGHIKELQKRLIDEDCYLPWMKAEMSELTASAKLEASQGNAEAVRDGWYRQIGEDTHAWEAGAGDSLTYTLASERKIETVLLRLDSAMDIDITLSENLRRDASTYVPRPMPKAFRIEGKQGDGWVEIANVTQNYQRFVKIPINGSYSAIRFTIDSTWGSEKSRVYGFELK